MSTAPTRPLGFMTREVIDTHLASDPELHALALEVRAACDKTAAAGEQLFELTRPEKVLAAEQADRAAELDAGRADVWIDPGHPNADALAADVEAARRELEARTKVSDAGVRRWASLLRRRVAEVTAADALATATAQGKLTAALEKLRPTLAEADARARRVSWLQRLAAEGFETPNRPKVLSPDHMPVVPGLVGQLDELLAQVRGTQS